MIKQLKASLQLAQMRYSSNHSKENKEILKRATEQYEAEIKKKSDPDTGSDDTTDPEVEKKKTAKKESSKIKPLSGEKVVSVQTDVADDTSGDEPEVTATTDGAKEPEEKKTEVS